MDSRFTDACITYNKETGKRKLRNKTGKKWMFIYFIIIIIIFTIIIDTLYYCY
jgi:t-SNARE complex subunit (syntaxin)